MKNDKIKVINLFSPPPYETYENEKGERRKIKTNMMSREPLNNEAWHNFLNCRYEDVIIVQNKFEKSAKMKAIINKSRKENEDRLEDNSVVSKLLERYTAIDNTISDLRRTNKVKPFCQKGCSECCSHYFYISMVEYFAIKYQLISDGCFEAAKQKGASQYLELKDANKKEFDLLESKKEDDIFFNDHLNLEKFRPCPLLGENRECMAYETRSIICRLYGSTGNFSPCDKILKKHEIPFLKVTFGKSIEKHILTKPINIGDLESNIYGLQHKNNFRILRPYPLIYWLYHDEQYTAYYKSAIAKDEAGFAKSIWG